MSLSLLYAILFIVVPKSDHPESKSALVRSSPPNNRRRTDRAWLTDLPERPPLALFGSVQERHFSRARLFGVTGVGVHFFHAKFRSRISSLRPVRSDFYPTRQRITPNTVYTAGVPCGSSAGHHFAVPAEVELRLQPSFLNFCLARRGTAEVRIFV